MNTTRRKFVTLFGTIGLLSIARPTASALEQDASSRIPNASNQKDESPSPKIPINGILESNEKDIKKNVDKLLELATALKEEVQKTDSAKVLSLILIKKAEEIEKLAHDIKVRAKG